MPSLIGLVVGFAVVIVLAAIVVVMIPIMRSCL